MISYVFMAAVLYVFPSLEMVKLDNQQYYFSTQVACEQYQKGTVEGLNEEKGMAEKSGYKIQDIKVTECTKKEVK